MRTHHFDFKDIELPDGSICSGTGSFDYYLHEREPDSPDNYECFVADEDTVKISSVTISDGDSTAIYNENEINKKLSDDVISALNDNYVIDSELDKLFDNK
jgi:hypothetical protein